MKVVRVRDSISISFAGVLTVAGVLTIVGVGMLSLGCSSNEGENATSAQAKSRPDIQDAPGASGVAESSRKRSTTDNGRQTPAKRADEQGDNVAPSPHRRPERTFEDLLNSPDAEPDPHAFGGAEFGHPQHDDAKLAAAGFRKIPGERLNVYTDLPRGDVDDFPRVFGLAVEQWQSYFDLPDEKLDRWRMTAYVIENKQLATRSGLIPDDLPEFQHGFQRGFEMWVYEQPSDYYRRHLLLHEGTHAVMNTLLGGAGPPWYMEGVAELLATHRWDGEALTLRYNPPDKEEVPYWGRVKIVRDDFAADEGLPLEAVMNYDSRAHQCVNAYAWCWAACLFLDTHPQTQAAFRKMQQHVRLPGVDFNRRFLESVAEGWNRIAHEQWFLYVKSLDYGSDPRAAIVHYAEGKPLPEDGAVVDVQTGPGWQSAGIEVEVGQNYLIRAAGRYVIAREPDGTPWPCEPGGVTLRYHEGRPLGKLLMGVRRGEPRAGVAPDLSRPLPVGLQTKLTPNYSGTLYFQVNDSPAQRHDNEGTLKVQIKPSGS